MFNVKTIKQESKAGGEPGGGTASRGCLAEKRHCLRRWRGHDDYQYGGMITSCLAAGEASGRRSMAILATTARRLAGEGLPD